MNQIRPSFALAFPCSLLFLCSGCATSQPNEQKNTAVEVVARLSDLSKTPEWSLNTGRFSNEGDRLVFVHGTKIGAEGKPEACLQALAESGRAALLGALKDRLVLRADVAGMARSGDPAMMTLLSFLAKGELPDAEISEAFWEKRIEPASLGVRYLVIRCAVKVRTERSPLLRRLFAVANEASAGDGRKAEKINEILQDEFNALGLEKKEEAR